MPRRFWLFILVSTVVIIGFVVSFGFEYARGATIFQDYFAAWETEISHEMIKSQDHQLLNKIIAQVPLLHSALKISAIQANGKRQELSGQSDGRCSFPLRQSLTYNLIPVGEVNACLQSARLLELSVTSPFFIGFIAFGILGLFLYYKKEEKIRMELQLSHFLSAISRQVAHDIRAPLMAIETVIGTAEGLDQAKKKLLQEASRRIQTIAADILDQTRQSHFAKQTQNDQKKSESCAILSCTQSILQQFKVTHTRIDFRFDGKCHESTQIPFAQQIYERMLSNLIQNSIEAISEKGRITVQLFEKSGKVYLGIMDNGIGMNEEQLKKFGQSGLTTKSKGNGLGVSYVLRQLQEFGGQYEVSSKQGLGTQIQIVFPIFLR